MNPIRLRLLEREVEFLCGVALDAADELEAGTGIDRDADGPILAQAIAHFALKVSYLLWRFGRRVTDRYGADEAEALLSRLSLTVDSPLSPDNLAPFADLLTLSAGELLRAVNPELMTVTVRGVTRSLRPAVAAMARIAAELGATRADAMFPDAASAR